MSSIFKNIFISIGVGYLFAEIQVFLETEFLISFLEDNLIILLVALIAINSTTLSLVLAKIRELIDKNGNKRSFKKTRNEMILSIKEQIGLIVLSAIFLMIRDSVYIKNHGQYTILFDTLIIGIFVYAIIILYDTAKSIFVILDYQDDKNN